jgi:hypothetical protein
MARGQYMIDEDCSNNSYHEHVQATTFESEEVDKETVNESSLKDPLEESFAQFEFDLDLDMIREQAYALLDPTPGMRTKNGETVETSFPNSFPLATEPLVIENNKVEEKEEQIEPPPNFSNDKEVSTKAHSFITIPFETQHEPQASSFQCLEELPM